MKKQIYFLVSLFALIGFSMNAKGQGSSGFRPFIGETKTYQVNSHPANVYTWTLTKSATDATTDDLISAGTIVTAPANYNGTGKNTIALTWVDPTVPTIYYLHVVENDNGCSNHKVMAIQPQNNFTLAIDNIKSDNTVKLADPFEQCAPDVIVTKWDDAGTNSTVDNLADAQGFTYNYGTREFYYRISADGINFETTTWQAKFSVAGTISSGVSVDYLIAADNAATPNWTSPTAGSLGANTIDVEKGKKTIFVRVTIANGANNEALSKQDFTITLDATSKENLGNQTAIIADFSSIQTQKARPETGGIHE